MRAGNALVPRSNSTASSLIKYRLGISLGIPLVLSLLPGCAQRTASPPPPSPQASGVYHIVKPGENLYRIGKAYDISIEEIARANSIKDPSRIQSGQRLLIPGAMRQLPVETIAPVEISHANRSTVSTDATNETLIWPIAGTINSGFGARGSGFHDGIDIAGVEGSPIRVIEKGEVIYSDQIRGYGNIVIVRHSGGIVSVYAHNQVNLVRAGQSVEQGEVIAKVGSTGRVTGPHLHFEIRKNNVAQDPLGYLPQLCCFPASDSLDPKG
jgi:murein DD-endopeptidase MepM/ murein hydrolase activator NlpD